MENQEDGVPLIVQNVENNYFIMEHKRGARRERSAN